MRGLERQSNSEEDAWIVPFPARTDGYYPQERTWGVKRAKPTTFPDRMFQRESFIAPPADNAEPYTLQWYLAIEHHRHNRQAKWIPELLEFGRHAGETLLGLGHGLGTDLVQYARQGARVIACKSDHEELSLVRRNFELRGLHGRFIHGEVQRLPLVSSTVDVVLIHGSLDDALSPSECVDEIFRVLKPGGKVVAVMPAKYSAGFWFRLTGRRSANGLSRRRLKKLFSPFTNYRIHKRHIRRRDLPWITRCLPRLWLERCFGSFLILKAFKPVSAAQQRVAA